jgi:hypothetical protein
MYLHRGSDLLTLCPPSLKRREAAPDSGYDDDKLGVDGGKRFTVAFVLAGSIIRGAMRVSSPMGMAFVLCP